MIYRKALFTDVEAIHSLVNAHAENGTMLPRSRNVLYETLRDMILAEEDGQVVGVGALHLVWDELAEIRALAVAPSHIRQRIGSRIVDELIKEAQALGVKTVFTLTYRDDFFSRHSFTVIEKEKLPHKVWKDCIECPKFPNCDEIAMIRELQ
ncbi:MAG: GCN5-related N-acetyltransferase [Firmicutes bacterium]|nr:GCN5-related N-acetyltransferase [Bacillota bacterium]